MKSKYLYISAGRVLDESSRLYAVMLGTSQREQNLVKRLATTAVQRGHYFAKWSADVAGFVSRIRESYPTLDHVSPISGKEVTRLLNNVDAIKDAPLSQAGYIQRSALSPAFYCSGQAARRAASSIA